MTDWFFDIIQALGARKAAGTLDGPPLPVPLPFPQAAPNAAPAATAGRPLPVPSVTLAPLDNFPACLAVILQSEGGFVIDQGGPTYAGVTIPALQAYLRRPVGKSDIVALASQPDVVAGLYRSNYFNAAHCNELPPGLDLMVMDEAINEGVGRAIRHLQEALGVTADGLFGPGTRAAVAACDVAATIGKLHDTNAAYYASLDATYPQDERGWHARNDRTRDLALTMVSA